MVVTPDILVTELVKFLRGRMPDVSTFKYRDKPLSHEAEYIAVNNLPFVFGYPLNDKNVLNVNVHVPNRQKGECDTGKLQSLADEVLRHIPLVGSTDDKHCLSLSNADYCAYSLTQPIEDVDNTHFINIKVRVIFKEL